MRKNVLAYLSIITSVISILFPKIAMLFYKKPAGSFVESITAQNVYISQCINISMTTAIVSVVFGIGAIILYRKNKTIKGKVPAILGIIIAFISLFIIYASNSIASDMSSLF